MLGDARANCVIVACRDGAEHDPPFIEGAVRLDLQFGDVGLALGLAPSRTVFDLAVSGGALDAGKLDAYLASHPSGVRTLLAPTRPEQAGSISADLLRGVYPLLR